MLKQFSLSTTGISDPKSRSVFSALSSNKVFNFKQFFFFFYFLFLMRQFLVKKKFIDFLKHSWGSFLIALKLEKLWSFLKYQEEHFEFKSQHFQTFWQSCAIKNHMKTTLILILPVWTRIRIFGKISFMLCFANFVQRKKFIITWECNEFLSSQQVSSKYRKLLSHDLV